MKSSKIGSSTLTNNTVTSITNLGFYILIEGKEYFVPFEKYPEFKKANVYEIYNFEIISPTQICWKLLDCDIEIESLENPEKYVLVYKK
ncbi:MAG: hypothetical protein A2033_06720 [Bacteroidetes bacterium GWA2_31_9]|nr:MAG: hypothetical protein A2033_06720 [Bacteroidetes bacterium GWA2_31_9]